MTVSFVYILLKKYICRIQKHVPFTYKNPLCEIALVLFQIDPIQMDDDCHFFCVMVYNGRPFLYLVKFRVSELL